MGKKRKKSAQKTKKISVAMAEASSTGGRGGEDQNSTPRKRGRPRKIVFEEELKEIETHDAQKQEEEEEKQQKQQEEITEKVKEQTSHMAEKRESSKEEQPKSKARRKSKPHKSC